MRRKIIAGNWKMNMLASECEGFLLSVRALAVGAECEPVVCVPFTHLERAARVLKDCEVALGAQNVAWAQKGAFTGEISAAMLEDCGTEFVIVGHSERRAMFADTNQTVNMRAAAAIKMGITPIVCVGETLEQREAGQTNEVLVQQTVQSLKGLSPKDFVVAYEPVWAIGTGKIPTMAEIEQAIAVIRANIEDGENVPILYGGSLNAKNAQQILALKEVDGGLIGGASLDANEFSSIIRVADALIKGA